MLDIPEEEMLVSAIALGYGEIEAKAPKRKEVEEVLKIY